MNTATDNLDPQCKNILAMLIELHRRKSPHYPKALDSILDKMPPDCEEVTRLRQHQQNYIKQLEKSQ